MNPIISDFVNGYVSCDNIFGYQFCGKAIIRQPNRAFLNDLRSIILQPNRAFLNDLR